MYKEFGYVRVGTAVPYVVVGAVTQNVKNMLALSNLLEPDKCDVVLFPELSLTAYTCADLFEQDTLLDAALEGLQEFVDKTAGSQTVYIIGAPLRSDAQSFNCAVVIQSGKILGAVPKTVIPNYREFYEKRWFTSARDAHRREIELCGQSVPMGADLLFRARSAPNFVFGVELCEDLWAPVPPSTHHALAGATMLFNISASDDLIGKSTYRRELVKSQSGRCIAGYAYCSAGVGESTTDLVFGGHCIAAENDTLMQESDRFKRDPDYMIADFDVDLLQQQRRQHTAFRDAMASHYGNHQPPRQHRDIEFEAISVKNPSIPLKRQIGPLPFVPGNASQRKETCREIFAIQSSGLAERLEHTGIRDLVIGLSGGLDSTQALLVATEACNRLGLSHSHIHGITMPGFGTSQRTLKNVQDLCLNLGVALQTIDITEASNQHFIDIGHDTKTHDTAYENTQARLRTMILMNKANMLNALVVGTGDLSELALGWCTYNGDHMSMYAVNTGVPKTLITFLIEFVANNWAEQEVAATLRDILETPVSPELLPPDVEGKISQHTEQTIGPYELHDFFLYQMVRCGFPPEKILFLAQQAFANAYDQQTILKWLRVFITRFFNNQFKRSCLPDGPKVGTIALSPRGDWRMPSDASAEEWLRRLDWHYLAK
ncbi:MAG: NAD(+) synthase [Lentisphaeria bacterium]